MAIRKPDLMFHPIRLQIVTALSGRAMTTAALAAALPRISQATLYRQIKLLVEGGLLEVVAEKKVNGALERTYQLVAGEGRLTPEDMQHVTREEHLQYYNVFAAMLIDAATEYIQQTDPPQVLKNGFSYSRIVLNLTPEQQAELTTAFDALVQQYAAQPPSADTQAFLLASTVIPQPNPEDEA